MEWKYHVLHLTEPISENHLKRMGAQCWELTGCVTYQYPASENTGAFILTKYVYYFKMPREMRIG